MYANDSLEHSGGVRRVTGGGYLPARPAPGRARRSSPEQDNQRPWTAQCGPAPDARSWHTAYQGRDGSAPGVGASPAPRPGRGLPGNGLWRARRREAGAGHGCPPEAVGRAPGRPVPVGAGEGQGTLGERHGILQAASQQIPRDQLDSPQRQIATRPIAVVCATACSRSGKASGRRPARAYAVPRSEANVGTSSWMLAAWQTPRPRSSTEMALGGRPGADIAGRYCGMPATAEEVIDRLGKSGLLRPLGPNPRRTRLPRLGTDQPAPGDAQGAGAPQTAHSAARQ